MQVSKEGPLLSRVAHICAGTEVYGVGSVQKLVAAELPHILFICLSGGHLYDWLRANGYRVVLLEGAATGNLKRLVVNSTGAAVLGAPSLLASAWHDSQLLAPVLLREEIRTIHTHWLPHLIVSGLMRPRGYKVIWHAHGNMNRRRLLGTGMLLNNILVRAAADYIIAVSDFTSKNWQLSGVRQEVIRNAASLLYAAPPRPPEYPIRCLTVGRLIRNKGHHVAIRAVSRAQAQGVDVRLDIFGGPLDGNSYADELRRLIAASTVPSSFRLMGFVPGMRSLHKNYTVALQCRIDPEPCSVWLCEALVDGLPVIASRTGGSPELVEDGTTGFLVSPENAAELAVKLLKIAEMSTHHRQQMSKAAYAAGKTDLSPQRFARQLLQVYSALA